MKSTFAIAVALIAAFVMPARGADVALRSRAEVGSTIVRLGDVATVRGLNKQDAKRLAALPLMPSPSPGKKRFLRIREVQDLLAAHGEDMSQLNFHGESMVEIAHVSSSSQPTTHDTTAAGESWRDAAWHGRSTAASANQLSESQTRELHDQLNRHIVAHLSRSSGRTAEWQVKFDVAAADLALVSTATSEIQCAGGNAPWNGKQRFVVSFMSARGKTRFPVFADVSVTQPVVVAIRPIESGDVLTAADVELQQWQNAPAVTGRNAPVDSVETVLGMEASRAIQVGDAIVADDFRPQLLVKRGEEIAVVARGGGIQVRTLARARQDGARGELIPVESLQTRETYDAVVVGFREAVVFSGGSTPTAEEDVTERPFRKLWQK